jgi:hypothetical protein
MLQAKALGITRHLIRIPSNCSASTGETTRHAAKDHAGHVPKWDYSFNVG